MTRTVQVGSLPLGGGNPVLVQSMTNTDTRDTEATLRQIRALHEAGCDLVRISVYDQDCAEAVKTLTDQSPVPLVADIHFDYRLAIRAAENGIAKLRINPGNIGGENRVRELADCAKEHGIPIRIGVNSGSAEKELLAKYGGPTAQCLTESALNHARMLEKVGFEDIVLSMKSSDVKLTIEAYYSTVTDMLMPNMRIPSNSGFTTVPYHNEGKMRNMGWEFHINTNRFIKKGKFYMDLNANFGNNRNEILEMDEYVLNNLNSTYGYANGEWLRRVQLHNPFGAIYGFKYKGVYTHNYKTFVNLDLTNEEYLQFKQGTLPDEWYAAHGWEKRPYTAPVVENAQGELIRESDGTPKRMRYDYRSDGTGHTSTFAGFNGGDAIYEDSNHDGNINALDICYLGSSLPKLTGGFGFSFNYGDWRLSTQFTYRVGNKILNMSRLNLESMIGNDNQSQAVNYRWRKESDVTTIPRAMHGKDAAYNSLVSDRYVEDGSYLRMSYAQLSYAIKKKYLTWIGLNRISFYASINNPFVITKYSGVDPDISQSGYDPAIDNAQTPRSRSYTLGLTVDF
mgnify:CR=1 FL=1